MPFRNPRLTRANTLTIPAAMRFLGQPVGGCECGCTGCAAVGTGSASVSWVPDDAVFVSTLRLSDGTIQQTTYS